MARQVGVVKMAGKLNDVVFYQTKEGSMARMVGGLDKKRVKKDPAFERSRKASVAFGHATQSAGLLRRAMGAFAMQFGETRMTGNLNSRMLDIIKTETTVFRDQRKVYRGDMGLLKGFEWNSERPVATVLRAQPETAIDRVSGAARIVVPSFICTKELKYPEGATHYELYGSAAALDFDKRQYDWDYQSDGQRAINGRGTGVLELNFQLKPDSRFPIVLGMGVVFYQNGALLQGGSCFKILEVDWIRP